ncbi:MAG TPA: hypothetical protein VJP79_07835 [Nitrososphaera sp.]|nr:hypothetical protein [Nitrososphaera sp.]
MVSNQTGNRTGRALKTIAPCFLALVISSLTLLSSGNIFAHADTVTWSKSYGGPDTDEASSLEQTEDGGYIVAGTSESFSQHKDIWALKLDPAGDVVWQKAYGGSSDEYFRSIKQTPDGGYIAVGSTESFGVEFRNLWIVKLDPNGDIEWEKMYGGDGDNSGIAVGLTSDGGYIVSAETYSFGAGSNDAWILKLDSAGDIEWERAYGGSHSDWILSIQQTSDGGYIGAGLSNSEGGWILKLEPDGDVEWEKVYGNRHATSIEQTPDGGYIATGELYDDDEPQIWTLKLDSNGDIEWQKEYGYGMDPYVRYTSDGGYIVASNILVHVNPTNINLSVLKLDSNGTVEWQKAYGGSGQEAVIAGASIQETMDGGYIVGASSVVSNEQGVDFWILKLDEDGNTADCNTGSQDIEGQATEIDNPLVNASSDTELSEAEVAETEAAVQETESTVGNLCNLVNSSLDLFENTDEHSDGVVDPGSSVRAVAGTDNPSVSEVIFKWYAPDGNLVREVVVPLTSPEDTFTLDQDGTWTVMADFGNGEVITRTIDATFFVLPESPVGPVSLVMASMASLGAFLYFRMARRKTTFEA